MAWVAVRQILVDLSMLSILLIWMRMRGGSEGRDLSEDWVSGFQREAWEG